MGLLDLLNPIKAVSDIAMGIIGKFVGDPKEKAEAQLALFTAQAELQAKLLDYQGTLAQEQAKVIVAEAQSESWLARNWRPILMLAFTVIITWNYIISPLTGAASVLIPDRMWSLLELGISGYIGGRTLEKIVPGVITALGKG